jgi:hypothetical protein
MEEIIAKEGIDCDFWRGFTYAVRSSPFFPWSLVPLSMSD